MTRNEAACATFETLEPRQLLSTFTVMNDEDSGAGSLRQAIIEANALGGADIIEFDPSLSNGTITLTTGELLITDELTITGLGAGLLAVDGNDSSRVFSNSAITRISGLTITGGNSGGDFGGGLKNIGTLTLAESIVSGNTANSGGGIDSEDGTLTLTNSTVSENTASFGGGISSFRGALTLTNSTVSGNTASSSGGGIDMLDSTLTLTNSTIANNLGGGGFYIDGGTTTLTSTIVAGNTGGDIANGTLEAGSFNNLIQDVGSAGGLTDGADGNIVGQDPLLDDLAANGGPTMTHALLEGSPAIGAGSNPGSLTTDQRGGLFGRGSSVDIGAYQRQSFALVVDTVDDGDDGDYSAGNLSLREALTVAPNPGTDTITFDPTLNGGTILLGGTELSITGDITITGPGADLLAVSGNDESRVFNNSATTGISGLTITGGDSGAGRSGGGISNDDGTLTLTSLIVSGNTAGRDGGGIHNVDGTLTLTNSTVSGNVAGRDGGGISTVFGTLTLMDTIVSENEAGADGGGIGVGNSNVTITNSTVSLNTADDEAGGLLLEGSLLQMAHSTVSGNTAVASGGGMLLDEADLIMTNSTVSGNTSGDLGGGLVVFGDVSESLLTLSNSTIANNLGGGGLSLNGGTTTLTSTIVAGNAGGDIFVGFLEAGSFNNLIQDPGSAGGLTDGDNGNLVGHDPLLDDLAANGGPTMTHALLEGSPAIGAGSNPGSLTTDQRGGLFGRGSSVDIGAYQRQSFALVVDTLADGDDGDYSAGNLSLREALTVAPNPGTDTITFDPSLNGGTITLGGTELSITGDITITGPGVDLLAVSGNDESRVFNNSATTSISGLTIASGYSGNGLGGGIYNFYGTLTLTDSTVAENRTDASAGGIYNTGTMTLVNSTVSGNTAGTEGGGIQQYGIMTLINSTVSGNTAINAGGISSGGTMMLIDSAVSGNTATGSVGGIYTSSTMTLTNSTVSGNTARNNAGGIWNTGGRTLTLTNSTVSGNSAGSEGGGILNIASPNLILTNSTIANNLGGGGLFLSDMGGTVTLTSTIVAGNSGGDILNGTLESGSSNNLIQDAGSAGGLTDGAEGNIVGHDPLLGDLADNGGPTLTHALLLGSPAIDAGSNPDSLTTDQRGTARARGDSPDIGSYEANARPTLASLTGSTGTLVQGDTITLTATGAADSDGTIAEVRFYLDRNGDGIGQASELLGSDTGGSNGYSLVLSGTQTAAISLGTAFFLAVAIDNDGGASDARSVSATVLYSLLAGDGSIVSGSSTADGTFWTAVINEAGDPIVFNTSTETAYHLGTEANAPAATGDIAVWVDPKDGLLYVAYSAADGLILVTRAADGSFSFQNLSTEVDGAGDNAPVRSFAQFTSTGATDQLIVLAGINTDGDLVAFQQELTGGVWGWTFVNISDDLDSQGMTTPVLTQMTSYVTSWNQWTLAGLDAAGNVQGVWVNVSAFTTWRVDNLSAITGADTLSGELDVTLTTWGGIRFSGADTDGNLIATWWNPGLGGGNWKQTNLTDQVTGTGPALTGGSLTAWFASGNLISYAGYDDAGDIVSYYWQPSSGSVWNSDNLTASLSNRASRPVGRITSHVSDSGETSIVGASSDRDVVRLWSLSASDSFGLDNLSDLVARA